MAEALYLVMAGAPLTGRAVDAVAAARARGWNPAIIATPSGAQWLDREHLAALGVPVLDGQRTPDEPKRLPPAQAVILAPGTFNTINKLATGAADTYALSVLCESLGSKTPMVIVPFVNAKLAGHPAWFASLAVLRYAGAVQIDPRNGAVNSHDPIESGTGDQVAADFRWNWALDTIPASKP